MSRPGYWMYETGGALRPAIVAYLNRDPINDEQIALIRAYLRQWVAGFHGPDVERLADEVDGVVDRAAIDRFLYKCDQIGIDPL